jgi:hypothetical protein
MEQESAPKWLKKNKIKKKAEDMSFCIHHPAD